LAKKVEWTEASLDDLQKLDKPIISRILKKISWFSENFDNVTPEALTGDLSGAFKLRIGDWRVVYTIEKDLVLIHAIGHRREIYK